MIVAKLSDLPSEYTCNLCGRTKPVNEMVVVRRRDVGGFHLRQRCKECHNARERGHRREYKRKYLQRWRAKNADVDKSYWNNPESREKARVRAAGKFKDQTYHEALLIQGRLNRRDMEVSISEAKELLQTYGRCYPSRFGLTPEGLKECERIRSRMRQRGGKVLPSFQIRLMVYEDGFYITPARQPVPYKSAARRLRKWQKEQREWRETSHEWQTEQKDNKRLHSSRSTSTCGASSGAPLSFPRKELTHADHES